MKLGSLILSVSPSKGGQLVPGYADEPLPNEAEAPQGAGGLGEPVRPCSQCRLLTGIPGR